MTPFSRREAHWPIRARGVQNRGVSSTIPDTAPSWVERDAAVIWHGFTQMATYADNAPLMIERAEGRELIDAEGRRYLDAISSLWVNTLGHRVPELDAALAAQAGKVAHSTMLGNGNTVVVELAEALAPARARGGSPLPLRRRRCGRGGAGTEDRLPVLGQPRRRRAALSSWRWAMRTTGTRSGRCPSATAACSAPSSGRCASRSCAHRATPIPVGPTRPAPPSPRTRASWPRSCSSRSCRARRACSWPNPADVRRVGDACRDAGVLLVCDEVATGFGRTGSLFASEQCGLRPDLLCLGKGITGGYLAMSATVASGRGVRRIPRRRPRAARPSITGTPMVGTRWPLRSRSSICASSTPGTCSPTSWPGRRNWPISWPDASSPTRRCARSANAGSWSASSWRHREDGLRWGRRVCAGAVDRGVLLRPLGDVVVVMPPLTITEAEVVRVVDALADALDEVTQVVVSSGELGRPASGRSWQQVVERGTLARAARRSTLWVLRGRSREPTSMSFASNDYLGLSCHPAVRGRRARRARSLGYRGGCVAARHGLPPRPRRTRRRSWPVEGHRGRRLLPERASRPTWASSASSAVRASGSSLTSSTTPASSTAVGSRVPR